MKYIDEFRDKKLTAELAWWINKSVRRDYTFMEVCGGHTAAIHRFGIRQMLPASIRLVSGPGCPVCVTGTEYIDKAIALSLIDGVTLTTFGDLMRVPGSETTLERTKAAGADIRVLFSALDALDIARTNPERRIIFTGVGFETTVPGTAVTVLKAKEQGISNFLVLSGHKVMPPAMEAIIEEGNTIDGFICPGHVAVITGSSAFKFIPRKYKTACVITGFEPVDLLQSVLMLVKQVNSHRPDLEIQYSRAVSPDGNKTARKFMKQVFEPSDVPWRGLGIIPLSGLKIRREFERYDADKVLPLDVEVKEENPLCMCGDVLRGLKTPSECPLFASACVPSDPVGACMVSGEGACNSYYKYEAHE